MVGISFAGMKEIKIVLSVSDLLEEVRRRAEYIGKSLQQQGKDTTAYDRVRATTADDAQLTASVKNALSALKTHLQEWVKDTTSTVSDAGTANATLTLTLGMPANWDAHMTDAVEQEAREYAVLTTLGDWLGVTDKDDAGGVSQSAAEHLALLGEAVNKRLRPTMAHIKAITEETEESEDTGVTTAEFEALKTRVSTNEGNITTLQSDVSTEKSNTEALTTRTGTLEENVSALQGRMTTAESDITALYDNLSPITEELSDATTHVEECVERLDGHDKAINANKSAIATNAADIKTAQTNITALQTSVSTTKTECENKRLASSAPTANETTITYALNAADASTLTTLYLPPAVAGSTAGLLTAEKATLIDDTASGLVSLQGTVADNKTELEASIESNAEKLQKSITAVSEDFGTKLGAVDELTKRVDNLEAGGTGGSTEAKETVTSITAKDATMWPVAQETTIYVNRAEGEISTILLPFDAEFLGRRLRIIVEGGVAVKVAAGRAYRYHLYYNDANAFIIGNDDEVAGTIKSPAEGTSAVTIGACAMQTSGSTTNEDVYGLQLSKGAVELVAVPSGVTRYAVPTGTSVVIESNSVKDKYSIVPYTNDYANTVDDRTGKTSGCLTKATLDENDGEAVTDASKLGLEAVELVRWVLVTARGDVRGLNSGLSTTGTLI